MRNVIAGLALRDPGSRLRAVRGWTSCARRDGRGVVWSLSPSPASSCESRPSGEGTSCATAPPSPPTWGGRSPRQGNSPSPSRLRFSPRTPPTTGTSPRLYPAYLAAFYATAGVSLEVTKIAAIVMSLLLEKSGTVLRKALGILLQSILYGGGSLPRHQRGQLAFPSPLP